MKDLTKRGITMAIVTYEMDFARAVADRILFVDQGRLAEDGSPNQFFTNPQGDRAKPFLEKML
jgi:polar amino acid transport system ATP-binding protein